MKNTDSMPFFLLPRWCRCVTWVWRKIFNFISLYHKGCFSIKKHFFHASLNLWFMLTAAQVSVIWLGFKVREISVISFFPYFLSISLLQILPECILHLFLWCLYIIYIHFNCVNFFGLFYQCYFFLFTYCFYLSEVWYEYWTGWFPFIILGSLLAMWICLFSRLW